MTTRIGIRIIVISNYSYVLVVLSIEEAELCIIVQLWVIMRT